MASSSDAAEEQKSRRAEEHAALKGQDLTEGDGLRSDHGSDHESELTAR